MLTIINQRLCLLYRLKAQWLPSDSLQIIFHALIMSKVEYALPAIAGLLSETDKSRLDAFSERQNDVVIYSDFFISQTL